MSYMKRFLEEHRYRFWYAEKRYDYYGVDIYSYPAIDQVIEDSWPPAHPEKYMAESWMELNTGPVFTGSKKDCENVAFLCNDAYWHGMNEMISKQ
ncbi:MAG: hypothetical protein DRI65_17280 [Chloroflexota bacterium]|nr:MAG: hypothetical protein DRI65_17280 [Chloroflexota bacterium]